MNWKKLSLVPAMLLMAISWLISGCGAKQAHPQSETGVYYTCSMHTQIHKDKPGNCPICGMKLIRVASSGRQTESLDSTLSYLTQPVTQTVVGTFKVIEPLKTERADTIMAEGYLGFDQRDLNTVTTRVAGRIEKLYVKYTNQRIREGQPLMTIYSPQLLSVQRDLLYAMQDSDTLLVNGLKEQLLNLGMRAAEVQTVIEGKHPLLSIPIYSSYNGISRQTSGGVPDPGIAGVGQKRTMSGPQPGMEMGDNDGSMPATEQSGSQTELLNIREGMYVNRGQTILSVQDTRRSWAILNVFTPDLWGIHTGDAVSLYADANPAFVLKGRVDFIPPARSQDEKTTRIRVYLDHLPESWKIGTLIHGQVRASIESNSVYVPLSAVNRLGLRAVVWVQDRLHANIFHSRNVKTGIETGDAIQITNGIEPGDKIAANAAYMVDSDSFIE